MCHSLNSCLLLKPCRVIFLFHSFLFRNSLLKAWLICRKKFVKTQWRSRELVCIATDEESNVRSAFYFWINFNQLRILRENYVMTCRSDVHIGKKKSRMIDSGMSLLSSRAVQSESRSDCHLFCIYLFYFFSVCLDESWVVTFKQFRAGSWQISVHSKIRWFRFHDIRSY